MIIEKRGVKIGRLFGIDIVIDFSWFLIFILVTFIMTTNYYPEKYHDVFPTSFILGILTSVVMFLGALVHELSHSLVAKKLGVGVKRITLYLFGGLAELFEEPRDAETEFKIAIAGPAVSIVLSLIFAIFWTISDDFGLKLASDFFSTLFIINLIMAIFNLLPGFPLDGGRILRSIIWAITKNFYVAAQVSSTGGQAVAFFLIFFGTFQILLSGFWGGLWIIMIGLFLNRVAIQNLLEIKIKESLEKKRVKDFTQKISFVSPGLSVVEALDQFFEQNPESVLPIVENERIKGTISQNDIIQHTKRITENSRIGEIMKSYPDDIFLLQKDRVITALSIMTQREIFFVPVINNEDKIVGVITLDRITSFLSKKKLI